MHEQIPEIAAEIAKNFATFSQVRAVAVSGSRASSAADTSSDLDIYVYADRDIPVEFRTGLAKRYGSRNEIDNRVWEAGDEWEVSLTGLHVDIMYRRPEWLEGVFRDLLEGNHAQVGYTTCIWFNVSTAIPLYDRSGWFAEVQSHSHRPYPDALKDAIIRKNLPLLRSAFGSFRAQILKAVERNDRISVNHRVAAFLASYFDILFAMNKALHPGEKRLMTYALGLPTKPPNLGEAVNRLLTHPFDNIVASAECIDMLCDGLELCLADKNPR